MDAVHKVKNEEGDGGGGGGTPVHPRREEITDTMIFGPSDLVTMICRDVDLNYAIRGVYTEVRLSGSVRNINIFNALCVLVFRHFHRLCNRLNKNKW